MTSNGAADCSVGVVLVGAPNPNVSKFIFGNMPAVDNSSRYRKPMSFWEDWFCAATRATLLSINFEILYFVVRRHTGGSISPGLILVTSY
jgi:hypothetical protein